MGVKEELPAAIGLCVGVVGAGEHGYGLCVICCLVVVLLRLPRRSPAGTGRPDASEAEEIDAIRGGGGI